MARDNRDHDHPLARALAEAGAKPDTLTAEGGDNRSAKKNWAQRFSNALAMTVADELRPLYPKARVTPRPDGSGQEYSVGGKVVRKRTDVGVWDDAAGLVAGVNQDIYLPRHTRCDEPQTGSRGPIRPQRQTKRYGTTGRS